MRWTDYEKRSNETTKHHRLTRRGGIAACERCDVPTLAQPGLTVGASGGTLAQLARFGLAITGDPLLELEREGF